MTTEQVFEIVEKSRKEFTKACDKFSKDGTDLERYARTQSHTFTQVNNAMKLAKQGAEITKRFYASCEAIILTLDSTCRQELFEKKDSLAIAAVSELLEEIVDRMSKTSTSFNIVINGVNLGEAAELNPTASVETSVIQKLWETQLYMLPDGDEAKAELKRRKDEKKRIEKEAEEKAKREKEESLDRAKKSLQDAKEKYDHTEENNKIIAKKESEEKLCEQKLQEFKITSEKACEDFRSELKKQAEEKKKSLEESIAKLKADRKGKKGQDKTDISNKISDAEAELAVVVSEEYIEAQFDKCRKVAEKMVEDYEKTLNRYIETRFKKETYRHTLPSQYSKVPQEWLSGLSDEELTIYKMMTDYYIGWLTVMEIRLCIPGLEEETNQKVSMWVRNLVSKGILKRAEIDGKIVFALIIADDIITEVIWKDNLKNGSVPEAPDVTFSKKDYELTKAELDKMKPSEPSGNFFQRLFKSR